jgi:hypothetical protein
VKEGAVLESLQPAVIPVVSAISGNRSWSFKSECRDGQPHRAVAAQVTREDLPIPIALFSSPHRGGPSDWLAIVVAKTTSVSIAFHSLPGETNVPAQRVLLPQQDLPDLVEPDAVLPELMVSDIKEDPGEDIFRLCSFSSSAPLFWHLRTAISGPNWRRIHTSPTKALQSKDLFWHVWRDSWAGQVKLLGRGTLTIETSSCAVALHPFPPSGRGLAVAPGDGVAVLHEHPLNPRRP